MEMISILRLIENKIFRENLSTNYIFPFKDCCRSVCMYFSSCISSNISEWFPQEYHKNFLLEFFFMEFLQQFLHFFLIFSSRRVFFIEIRSCWYLLRESFRYDYIFSQAFIKKKILEKSKEILPEVSPVVFPSFLLVILLF